MLLGVAHNGAYLERVLGHPAFASADLHTHFLEQHAADLALPGAAGPDLVTLLAAAVLVDPSAGADVPEPYASMGEWRN